MRRLRDSRVHRTESLPPAIGALVNEPAYAELAKEFGHARVVEALRDQVAAERGGEGVKGPERVLRVGAALRAAAAPRLRRVINASGVILHTNLGRAPLSRQAVEALAVAAGYSNLELDLDTGRRGERAALVSGLLIELFGCEAALVVNNNAAAILLALTALCKGKEVIVSRGQQVEIGGSFRMPDVMRLSGARMVEVGTTNRTRQDDYEQAMTSRSAALLRVHTSNFRVAGFTEATTLAQMSAVAHAHELLLIDDLGSGAAQPIADEPTVAESLQHSDVVTFSGDKLFGGPQAGIVLGRGESGAGAVKKMSRHPLARAVRIDKLTLAALEATLRQRLSGRLNEIPVERMIQVPVDDVRRRAAMWSVKLEERGVRATLVVGESAIGGGSVPGHSLPTVLLALGGPASRLAAALRHGEPPVIARIEKDACCLDPRTVLKGEDETLLDAVEVAVRSVTAR
jgi:L-seryl-tRNA(Ser) seleniumtransferase